MLPLFIGDEVTAAAYRLAGLEIEITAPSDAKARLASALRRKPPLILITAACAGAVPAEALDAALAAFAPPVVIVPDAMAARPGPDLAARVDATLGIAA